MSKSQLVAAIESGVPFVVRMADGKEYQVPHRDYISISPKGSYAIVYDDEGMYFVLPLLTMTGIVSSDAEQKASS